MRVISVLAFLPFCAHVVAQDLHAVHMDTGQMYTVSTSAGAATPIGSTGVQALGSLMRAPDGFLYAVQAGTAPRLYRIDPSNASATPIGFLGLNFVFEGGLAMDASGAVWGTNGDNAFNAQLFTVDLATGVATVVVSIGPGDRDLNGIAFRSDGVLVGIDRPSNTLVTIDTTTGATTAIATLAPTLGGTGGMAVQGGTAYFSTSGTGGVSPGTNELWTIDLFTGAHALVGSLGPGIGGNGISGLAETAGSSFTLFCSGDGSVGPCPCGNNGGAGRGCENSAMTGGAKLAASGTTSPDAVVLTSSGELPTVLSIFLQGDLALATPAPFGDGLRCAGGFLKRLYQKNAVGGVVSAPAAGDPSITAQSAALGDPIAPGTTRRYQTYYRDPILTFCPSPPGNSWNVSSGVSIAW